MLTEMTSQAIYVKTEAGATELRTRAANLPWRLRTMLLLVDGSRDKAQLDESIRMVGAPDDSIEQLSRLGLIAPQAGAPAPADAPAVRPATKAEIRDEGLSFREAQKFMNETAVDALGIRAFFFTLKLEKCSTRPELMALMPEYAKILSKAHNEQVARMIEGQLRDKLR